MNEAETRAELIDPALNAAGWGVVEVSYIKGGTWVRVTTDIMPYRQGWRR